MIGTMNVVLMANVRDGMGVIVHPTAAKQSRDGRQAPVHHVTTENHALLNVNLFCLHPWSIQQL